MENYIYISTAIYLSFAFLYLLTLYISTGKILLSNLLVSLIPIINILSTILGWIQLIALWYSNNKDNIIIKQKLKKKKIPRP